VADGQSRCDAIEEHTRRRRSRGFSLIEVVVTITLMAVVIVPILVAVATSVKASSQTRSAAQVETALVNAADRINRAPMKCSYEIYAEAAVQSQGWDRNRASLTYAYYVPEALPGIPGHWANAVDFKACEIADTTTEKLVQRVTITITSPDGDIHRVIEVVKSRV
jgi:prepilin-type N-terminal cleavage/methylation domain-containing protein